MPARIQLRVRDRSGQQAPDQSDPCRTRTASPGSVYPSGPERQALDQSGPCRARTASAIDQSPITVVPAGPEQQALDQSTRSQWSLPDLDHKEPTNVYQIE